MTIRRVIIHHSRQQIRIRVSTGRNIWIKARWGVRLALITEPPTEERRPDFFFENPEVRVARQITPANPYFLECDPLWWEVQRVNERNVFTIVETKVSQNADWVELATFQWAINHDPVANAGPDRLIPLDATGTIPAAGVTLDGSGSTDQDLTSIDPDPGPLTFSWSSTGVPPGAENGAAATAASQLAALATPTWLAGGTIIPPEERGVYTFDLKVCDTEQAEIGEKQGQPGENTATVRILLGSTSDRLAILTPTEGQPYYGNYDDGVGVVIHYAIGDSVANDPAYEGSWIVRLTIKQTINSPYVMPRTIDSPVYIEERVSRDRIGSFNWNGLPNHNLLGQRSASRLEPSLGAFDITIEILNRRWQQTGVLGAEQTEHRAVVLDLFRWRTPLEEVSFEDTFLTGTFMETGHGGHPGTRLHAGIDMTGGRDFFAARSGVYSYASNCDNSNVVRINTPGSYRVGYLHGNDIESHANNSIVLQGDRLGRVSNCGTGPVHLHFQLEEINNLGQVLRFINPLRVLSLLDTAPGYPEINAVMVRPAPGTGPASLEQRGDISGEADLIVLCRDNAHPRYSSSNQSFLTLYRLEVLDNGVPLPQPILFDQFNPMEVNAEAFYASEGIGQYPDRSDVSDLYYLLYRRWDTAPYDPDVGPRQFEIRAFDFAGHLVSHALTIGCDVDRDTGANPLRISAFAPVAIPLELLITNRLSGLARDNAGRAQDTDNFHVSLDNEPAGWTIAPNRTGSINSGTSQRVSFQLDPHGSAPLGVHTFEVIVSSNIILKIGTRLQVSVIVA